MSRFRSNGRALLRRALPFVVASRMFWGLDVVAVTSIQEIGAALRGGDFRKAIELAQDELRVEPRNAPVLTLLGIAQSKTDSAAVALISFHRALQVDPNYLPALEGAAEIEFKANDSRAPGDIDHILELRPEDQTSHAMRGVLSWKGKDCASAVHHFAAAGTVIDAQPEALKEYGTCLLALHQYEAATGVLRPFAEAEPPDASALAMLSEAYEGAGDTPRAVETLRRAIVSAPGRDDLYVQFAGLCFEHKSYQVGIDMIDAGLKRRPQSAKLYLARAVLRVQEGEYDRADEDFARGDLLDPRQTTGVSAQALAQMQANRVEDALKTVRTALKSHPGDAASWYVLSEVLVRRGAHAGSPEFAEALEASRKAIQLNPSFLLARDELSRLYLEAGQTDQAVTECRQTLALDPGNETALYHLVRALKRRATPADSAEVPELLARLSKARQAAQWQEQEASRFRLVEPPAENANHR